MIAWEGKLLHQPIDSGPARPKPAPVVGDRCDAVRGRPGRIAPRVTRQSRYPKSGAVASSEPVSRHLLSVIAGIVIVASMKGLMHVADEMQQELESDRVRP
jgi:hypothetical protein